MLASTIRVVVSTLVLVASVPTVWSASRTAIVFRHTFRAPSATLKCTPTLSSNYSQWNTYSAKPWPDFGTAPQNATVRGLQLTKEFAKYLPRKLNQVTAGTMVELIYDENDRDRETAQALKEGLQEAGLNQVTMSSNASLFDVSKTGVCSSMDADNRTAALQEQFSVVPVPSNYESLMSAMQKILGSGSAPPLSDSMFNDFYYSGYWEGRTCLAASFAESFLFEYGSKILVGWGGVELNTNSTASNALFRLLENHVYYRSVNMKAPAVARHDRSNLVNAILRVLDGGDGSSSQSPLSDILTIFVGHDADVDQVSTMFNTTFQLKPDNQNAVPPMSGLVLAVDSWSDQLSAQYAGAMWDPQNKTDLVMTDVDVVSAYFVGDNTNLYTPITEDISPDTVSYSDTRAKVYQTLYAPCVENMVGPTADQPVSVWLIVGCVIGALVAVIVIGAMVWLMTRRGRGSAAEPLMNGV